MWGKRSARASEAKRSYAERHTGCGGCTAMYKPPGLLCQGTDLVWGSRAILSNLSNPWKASDVLDSPAGGWTMSIRSVKQGAISRISPNGVFGAAIA